MSALAIYQHFPPISSLQLPIELWNQIAGHLSKAELVSLCRVSKVFNTISTALLYHTIFFEDAERMVMCYKTLSSNDLAARSVRSLIVIIYYSCNSSAFDRLLPSPLIRLHGIMTLGLILPKDIPIPYLEDLQYCSFPYLEELSLSACLTPSVFTFIRRNNLHIRELYITSDLDSRNQAPPCTFPELKVYRGDSEFIPAFLPGSPVQQINITRRVLGVDNMEHILGALSRTTQSVEKISIYSVWDLHVFDCLSRHAPRVVDISFRADSEDLGAIEVFINGITSILAKFECIQSLFVMPTNPYGVKWSQFHNEYEILRSWSQKCPSLKLCTFPSAREWFLLDRNVWIPCWKDKTTRRGLLRIPLKDVPKCTWLEPLVYYLCGDSSQNPFKVQDILSGDPYSTAKSTASIGNEGGSDTGEINNWSDVDHPTEAASDFRAFLRFVRAGLGLAKQYQETPQTRE